MKNSLKAVAVIIGAVIGAGFASGKEIYVFFLIYGIKGIYGLIFSNLILCIIIYKVSKIMLINNVESYEELLEKIFVKNKKVVRLIEFVINCFLIISFFVMVAGFSGFLNQEFNISYILSSMIFVILCYFTLLKNSEGVINANNILVPILIACIIHISTINVDYNYQNLIIETKKNGFLISSLLYASYNSIILIPVIISIKKIIVPINETIKKIKINIWIISILTFLVLLILSFCVFLTLLHGNQEIYKLELPLMNIVFSYGARYRFIYGFIIISSIFTSAVAGGYSFLINISSTPHRYKTILIAMCIIAILASQLGFSFFVEKVYPIFGILGLIQIINLLKNHCKI